MLRIVILPLLLFLFSMACMGQTFQYSRGWTNGKRAGGGANSNSFNSLLRKDEDGITDLFEVQEANERRLERCLLQLQRFIHNPLLLHTSANTLALNPSATSLGGSIGNSNNNNNNPFGRNHPSNELFEELGTAGTGAIIDANDYAKH